MTNEDQNVERVVKTLGSFIGGFRGIVAVAMLPMLLQRVSAAHSCQLGPAARRGSLRGTSAER